MRTSYIFNFIKNVQKGDCSKPTNFLVLFFPYKGVGVDIDNFQIQLRDYFFNCSLPDHLLILGFDYNKTEIKDMFKSGSSVYNYIPKFQIDDQDQNLSIYVLQGTGNLNKVVGKTMSVDFLNEVYRRGMSKIFSEHGGLIISQAAHHFVFPSGKHCDRFLRTGNVLVNGAEIMFIASAIARHFKCRKFSTIYCDTSSINSLAYALIAILKELGLGMDVVHVESFGSYELFEKAKFKASRDSLFLISSSTSGSIITRMTEENRNRNIDLENIAVIYGLSVERRYQKQVVCKLDHDKDSNPKGLDQFVSYNVKKGLQCKLCDNGSTPLKVEGDVFLLEKPSVKGVKITVNDKPSFLKNFGDYYKSKKDDPSIIRAFYKDGKGTGNKKYEVYVNVEQLFSEWLTKTYTSEYSKKIFERLEKFIQQNIPASLRYMIVLPDNASSLLADLIIQVLANSGINFEKKNVIALSEIGTINPKEYGVIVVVSSSIVTGDNLLFLSRALRSFELTYRRMYFTFLARTKDKERQEFLENNLGYGEFGKSTHRSINVESITCVNDANTTPWHKELDFVKELQEYCENFGGQFAPAIEYCQLREEELNNSASSKGLENNLFFRSFAGRPLKLNNGFAFAPADRPFDLATQSEVYFIVSAILNEMRSKGKFEQSEYVRHVIEPGNFVRFNDGVIQACILRAATNEELKFILSEEMALQMKSILGDMILHLEDEHSEAINEFFYAIAIRKLKLPDSVLHECIELLEQQDSFNSSKSILNALVAYIKGKVIEPKKLADSFKDRTKDINEMKRAG
ncbi:hypothetical protein ACLOAU_02200 [Niabella sp. CJ426]|uniref:hypothetical protein n=1 Tax=Niabella sp. CJ426 TaxID=3393740 RepID=UPI003D088DC0